MQQMGGLKESVTPQSPNGRTCWFWLPCADPSGPASVIVAQDTSFQKPSHPSERKKLKGGRHASKWSRKEEWVQVWYHYQQHLLSKNMCSWVECVEEADSSQCCVLVHLIKQKKPALRSILPGKRDPLGPVDKHPHPTKTMPKAATAFLAKTPLRGHIKASSSSPASMWHFVSST